MGDLTILLNPSSCKSAQMGLKVSIIKIDLEQKVLETIRCYAIQHFFTVKKLINLR